MTTSASQAHDDPANRAMTAASDEAPNGETAPAHRPNDSIELLIKEAEDLRGKLETDRSKLNDVPSECPLCVVVACTVDILQWQKLMMLSRAGHIMTDMGTVSH